MGETLEERRLLHMLSVIIFKNMNLYLSVDGCLNFDLVEGTIQFNPLKETTAVPAIRQR
jgi:hypothetical protein